MDAVDAALVEINDNSLRTLAYHQYPIPAAIQKEVRKVNTAASLHKISELDVVIAELFANAIEQLLSDCNISKSGVCAIGSHGQTILHLPEEEKARTMQIGDPNTIAYSTGITTVADFRRMDIAAGGQGAPLACAFHDWHFRQPGINRVVLNIGGMANITILKADQKQDVIGFDTGPGNALMDDWTQEHLGKDYDEDGSWATSGRCHKELLDILLQETYFECEPPKSTGKDDFNLAWLNRKLKQLNIKPEDTQATLLELTAITISNAITRFAKDTEEMLICGGGIHNVAIMQRLTDLLPDMAINSTKKYGVDPDAVEAITFAWLAKQRLEGRAANLPSVTGAKMPVILGGVYEPPKRGN